MKKSLLALAVASLAASSVASAATVYNKDGASMDIYGRVQSVFYNSNMANSASGYDDNGAATTGRLGLNLRSDLGYGVAGIAMMEWDVEDGSKSGFRARDFYVGLDFGAGGIVKVGRMNNGINLVNDTTDIFEDQACWGNWGDERHDALIGYEFSSNGFDLRASYQLPANGQYMGKDYDGDLDLDSGFTVAAGYTTPAVGFGPIAFRAGYSEFTTQYKDGATGSMGAPVFKSDIKGFNQYAIGLGWGTVGNGLYLGALYNAKTFELLNNQPDVELTGYEAVVAYGFNNGLTVKAGYNYGEKEKGNTTHKIARVPLLADYAFNANFNVWVETSFDAGSDDKGDAYFTDQGNMFSAGMRYTF